jgi:hypothetical protein
MEDQRNWSDASFKTYCRPLSLPWPYGLSQGIPVRQAVRIRLSKAEQASSPPPLTRPDTALMPEVGLAHETGISDAAALGRFPTLPLHARIDGATTASELSTLARRAELTLELVLDDAAAELPALAERCAGAGLAPARVVALPRGYLASHQPEGPWPTGLRPDDLVPLLRRAFPRARVGGGSLTNFTEFNRCPPAPGPVDFVTFGNTAIVHAADDLSVLETLETLPHIFASAAALAAGRPIRLGLVSIGMRSNPYGAGVIPNPRLVPTPMAMDDPRQTRAFAAAYAVGVLADAAVHGVQSLCLGMADGPLGITAAGALTPLGEVALHAAGLARQEVKVRREGPVVALETSGGGIHANLSGRSATIRLDRPARVLGNGPARAADAGEAVLGPFDVALTGGAPR